MNTLGILFVKLLRAIAGFGLFIAIILFGNHIIGFIFGIGFKSVGEVTLDLLGGELLAIILFGGLYWMLDHLYNKISSNKFTSYLKQAMTDMADGKDAGKELLLAETSKRRAIQELIQQNKPWVKAVQVSQTRITGADIDLAEYGQKINLKVETGRDIEFNVDDMQLAQIIVHLLPYHDKQIFSEIGA